MIPFGTVFSPKDHSVLFQELQNIGLLKTESPEKSTDKTSIAAGDSAGFSPDTARKLMIGRAQFEVNLNVIQSVHKANGSEVKDISFSFKGAFEFLSMASGRTPPGQETPPVNADGTENTDASQAAKTSETAETTEANNLLDQLMEFFSPENTANRILDVAMSFFPRSGIFAEQGDTEASRSEYRDFIGKAIEEGFAQAKAILGDLTKEVGSLVDQTKNLVTVGLEDFVKNGIPSRFQGDEGVFAKIAGYQETMMSFSFSYQSSQTTIYSSSGKQATEPSAPGGELNVKG
jgi:hypothetical protein